MKGGTIKKELHLRSCEIKEMENGAFIHLKQLQTLDLDYNNLKKLEIESFDSLRQTLLKLSISVQNNNIDDQVDSKIEIGLGFFDKFEKLTDLSLNYGAKNVKPGMFKDLKSLEKLTLVGHQIESVDVNAFQGLENLKALIFNHNFYLQGVVQSVTLENVKEKFSLNKLTFFNIIDNFW